jgi:hypothetical protein
LSETGFLPDNRDILSNAYKNNRSFRLTDMCRLLSIGLQDDLNSWKRPWPIQANI